MITDCPHFIQEGWTGIAVSRSIDHEDQESEPWNTEKTRKGKVKDASRTLRAFTRKTVNHLVFCGSSPHGLTTPVRCSSMFCGSVPALPGRSQPGGIGRHRRWFGVDSGRVRQGHIAQERRISGPSDGRDGRQVKNTTGWHRDCKSRYSLTVH